MCDVIGPERLVEAPIFRKSSNKMAVATNEVRIHIYLLGVAQIRSKEQTWIGVRSISVSISIYY